ncbi:hypothetical protein LP415_06445 [Polaromonas sp. P1(28)-8]|nr:hypothetical protein LP415_06445 [Polaromonas sp. P1(28)-8]
MATNTAIASLAWRRLPAKKLLVLLLLLPLMAATFSVHAQDGAQAATQTSVQQGVTVKVTPRVVGADKRAGNSPSCSTPTAATSMMTS